MDIIYRIMELVDKHGSIKPLYDECERCRVSVIQCPGNIKPFYKEFFIQISTIHTFSDGYFYQVRATNIRDRGNDNWKSPVQFTVATSDPKLLGSCLEEIVCEIDAYDASKEDADER